MPNTRLSLITALALAAPPCVFAQTGIVTTGAAPDTVRLPSGWTRALACQADGTLWCLVHQSDCSGQPAGIRLRLFTSTDDGGTWSAAADTPTLADGRGAVVADRGCDLLHVTWSARDTGSYHNLYYQRFDAAASAWVGTPDLVLQGTTGDDQYYPNDISITARGTVGIVFNTHRTPTLTGFPGWSGGLVVRRLADPAFQPPVRLNVDSYGMLASMQAVGEVFHTTFRTNTGLYGIRYRAFDTESMQFLTTDLPLYGSNQSNMRSTNSSLIVADNDGNLYVIYSVGSPNTTGSLEVAFAQPSTGYSVWNTTLLEDDPGLLPGNVTYHHYSLARGENGTVYAVFSKANENFQNLYFRLLTPDTTNGVAIVTPDPAAVAAIPLLPSTEADTFQRVDAMRAEAVHGGAMIAYSGSPASRSDGEVGFLSLSAPARTVEWGLSCQGNLNDLPRLASQNIPQLGATFQFSLSPVPTGTPGVLFAGFDCLRPPFELGSSGMPGCSVFFTPLNTSFFVAGSGGAATFSFPIPAGLLGGVDVLFGTLQFRPMANATGAVVSNALAVLVR